MEYYDCANPDIVNSEEWSPYTDGCPVVDGDTLRISMAMIYDYNGESGGVGVLILNLRLVILEV